MNPKKKYSHCKINYKELALLLLMLLVSFEVRAEAGALCETQPVNPCSLEALPLQNMAEPTAIADVCFCGAVKTDIAILKQKMSFPSDVKVSKALIEDYLQELRNMRIFRSVDSSLVKISGNNFLLISIAEKQTLLPFFRMKTGGGTTNFILGVGDLNSFGKAIELLPQYENFDGKYHGGKIEYLFPSLAGHDISLAGSAGHQTEQLILFSKDNSIQEKSIEQNTFLANTFGFAARKNLKFYFSLLARKNTVVGEKSKDFILSPGLGTSIGKLDFFDYRVAGLNGDIGLTATFSEHSFPFYHLNLGGYHYKMLTSFLDTALRIKAEFVLAKFSLPWREYCSVGGFSEVRGYPDDRFRGNLCLYANAEARFLGLVTDLIVIQPVLFLDAGFVREMQVSSAEMTTPLSVGSGLRFIFPSLARLALRIDYAFPLSFPNGTDHISLGSQQFFYTY